MRVFAFLCICAPLGAQSLQILPSPPAGNTAGSFQIMIVTPKSTAPAALQWSIRVSEGIAVDPQQIKAGNAAQEAQKALTCTVTAGKDKQATERKWVCILAGGLKSIPDGPVAMVPFTAAAGTRSATAQVGDGLGATVDGKPIAYAGSDATLPLRSRPAAK